MVVKIKIQSVNIKRLQTGSFCAGVVRQTQSLMVHTREEVNIL